MKNLNISKITFALLLSTGVVFSCKDYLEINPVSSFGTDYVFSNVTNATKALYGVYAELGGDHGYGIRVSMYYPYDNDLMMGQDGNPEGGRRSIARYQVEPGNTELHRAFNQLYRGIEKANLAIYNIPLMDLYNSGSASDKLELRRLYGEALTLRAQFYLELVRNWGDLPAHFLPASFEDDLFKTKTDRDEIYDRLLDDLALAATLVPWRSSATSTNERITQGAVRGLRARIALFRSGYSLRKSGQMERSADYMTYYQIARDETKAIMDSQEHALNPSFEAVFKDAICAHQQEPNGEILWEVGMSGGSSGVGDSKLGYYNGPRWNSRGNGALNILPTYFYSFDPNDTRRDVTAAPYNINQDGTYVGRSLNQVTDGKFRRDWIVPDALESLAQYFQLNWPIIRYADVLLMFAEAENELNNGPTTAGIAAFEEVRTRAFGGDAGLIGTTPSDYAGFFEAIINERAFEFGAEGIRKYDLIRWNLLQTKLEETKAKLTDLVAGNPPYDNLPTTMYYTEGLYQIEWANSFYQPSPIVQPPGTGSITWVNDNITDRLTDYLASGFTPGKSELFPLHTTTLDANPNLVQDYGYGE